MGLSRSWVSGITVEPCMFFFSLCNGMFVIIAQNLYIAKADMLAVFGSCSFFCKINIKIVSTDHKLQIALGGDNFVDKHQNINLSV